MPIGTNATDRISNTIAPAQAGATPAYGNALLAWQHEIALYFSLQIEVSQRLGTIASRATEEMMEVWGVSPIGSAAIRARQIEL